MPDRMRIYLNRMDSLRDETDEKVTDMLKSVNIKKLMVNPEKNLKLFVLKFLKDNNSLFRRARTEGQKLAKTL